MKKNLENWHFFNSVIYFKPLFFLETVTATGIGCAKRALRI